ncbi:MAG: MlaD family protein [Myxococcota bacterium]
MSPQAKVGLFALGALLLGALLILRIEDLRLGGKRARVYEVLLDSAQGLEEHGDVRLSGVRVGEVRALKLVPEGVLVTVELEEGVPVREGAVASVGSLGLLGEKHVDIVQGPAGATPLPEGARIRAERKPSMEDALGLVAQVGDDLKEVTANLRATLGGPRGREHLEAVVDNLVQVTGDLAQLVETNQENVDRTLANFREFSTSMKTLAERIDRLTESREAEMGESIDNLASLTGKLDTAAEHVASIAGKIDRGEGTLGQLIADTETGDRLEAALEGVGEGVASLRQIIAQVVDTKVYLGLRAEYLPDIAAAKGYFHLDLAPPNSPRFYRFEVMSQPLGMRTESVTTTTVDVLNGGPPQVVEIREVERRDIFAFSLLVGWRFDPLPLVVRAGLMESRGGVGLDVLLLKERLRLTADLWDFERNGPNPHLKVHGALYVFPNAWVMAGWDDFLNVDRDLSSVFLGAGVRWDAEDIKYLLPSVPTPQ